MLRLVAELLGIWLKADQYSWVNWLAGVTGCIFWMMFAVFGKNELPRIPPMSRVRYILDNLHVTIASAIVCPGFAYLIVGFKQIAVGQTCSLSTPD